MNKKQLVLASGVLLVLIAVLTFSSCKKVGFATELGDGLVPAVDNVTTFDTTLTVESYNYAFTSAEDSIRVIGSDIHFLGNIIPGADPFFGATTAETYLELKPAFYPFAFARKDSLKIDSVVLVLDYSGTYGDTATQQQFEVYEVDPLFTGFKADSAYRLTSPLGSIPTVGPALGSKTFFPQELNDTVKAFRDTTISQLRIKLDTAFGGRLLRYDTAITYKSDSGFRAKLKGFAIKPVAGMGKAILGFNLAGANTKLAIYYKFPKAGTGVDSTTVNYFSFGTLICASANFVERNRSGSASSLTFGDAAADDRLYVSNTPGSYSIIKIPGLPGLSNRIIHRAELITEQIYDISDKTYPAPQRLFLDFYDSTKSYYATSNFDFYKNSISGDFNYSLYGTDGKEKPDGSGNTIREWKFDLSRYVQGIITGREKYYPLRLHSPFLTIVEYSISSPGASIVSLRQKETVQLNGSSTIGRVRLRGGNNSSQPMRLRIIYSKL